MHGSAVELGNINEKPRNFGVNSWIGQNQIHVRWGWERDFAAFFLRFHKFMAGTAGLPCPFTKSADLLLDDSRIHARSLNYGQDRILFINSRPQSYQWSENVRPLERLLPSLAGRVVTTEVVSPGILPYPLPCTRVVAPRLFDIAALAARVDYVIGIDTGPMAATYNQYCTAKHIVCHNSVSYNGYPNTVTVKSIPQLLEVLKEERLLI